MPMFAEQFGYDRRHDPDSQELDYIQGHPLSGGESRAAQLTGPKALMLAVFEDGVRCYLGHARLAAAEAEYWLESRRRGSPFSFVVICETFGLNPDATRDAIKRMKADKVPPHRALPRVRNNVRVPGRVCLRTGSHRRRRKNGKPQRRTVRR